MTIEIDESTVSGLEARFDLIKECAKDGEKLPDGFWADRIDLYFYEMLKELWSNYRKKINTYDETVSLGKNYRNRYTADKGLLKLTLEIGKKDLENRRKASVLVTKLFICDELTLDEAFALIGEIIAVCFDEISGKQVENNLKILLKKERQNHA